MILKIIATDQTGTPGELFPQTSFSGGVPSAEWMLANGVEDAYPPILATPWPPFDPLTQKAQALAPAVVNGVLTQQWKVVALYADYTDDQGVVHTKAKQEAAAIAADQDDKKKRDIATVRQDAQTLILAKYPLWVQSNYALGIYLQPDTDAMKAAIASVITECNRCEDAITAGTQETPNWPTI